jgi:hypothetical protein
MTVDPAFNDPYAGQRKLSISSLLSFICGLLFCVPFAGGLALILGIIGFIRTANPMKKGRWMAIVGGLLGLFTLMMWVIFGGAMIATVFAAVGLTEAPRVATREFIRGLADDTPALVEKHNGGFSDEQLTMFKEYIQKQGKFDDVTFNQTSINNSTAKASGTATFASGKQRVVAALRKIDDEWKVTEFEMRPEK